MGYQLITSIGKLVEVFKIRINALFILILMVFFDEVAVS